MLEMRLHDSPFNKIASGTKTFEIRLNDEKRRALKIGDKIKFINRVTKQTIIAEVQDLLYFNNFIELYDAFPNKVVLGYNKSEKANPADMEQYYSPSEQKQYGVVAIKIKLINKE